MNQPGYVFRIVSQSFNSPTRKEYKQETQRKTGKYLAEDWRILQVNIAGFQPPQVDPEDIFRANALGPMLIICGSEDEVCTRPPLSMKYAT